MLRRNFPGSPTASPTSPASGRRRVSATSTSSRTSPRKDAPPSAGIVEGNVIPYLPAALEQKKKNFAARATNDPRAKCFTLGVPRQIYYPEPFQIFQRERDVTLLPQFGNSLRTIHTNGVVASH